MKVLPFHIPKTSESSVIYQHDIQPLLYDTLHSHDETQLTLIEQKSGTVYIGGYTEAYNEGDIYLIRGGVPHVFKSDPNTDGDAMAISVFFSHEQFAGLEALSEFKSVTELLDECGKGARITGDTRMKTSEFIKAMESDGDFQRVIKLIVLLRMIRETGDFESFDTHIPKRFNHAYEGDRMNNVLNYTFNHFDEDITIDTISDIANMTNQAFCRYFKKHTRKSYINFLNEVRINSVMQMLNNPERTVSEIAIAVGFKNLSNFNRFFRRITSTTPSAYRKTLDIHKH